MTRSTPCSRAGRSCARRPRHSAASFRNGHDARVEEKDYETRTGVVALLPVALGGQAPTSPARPVTFNETSRRSSQELRNLSSTERGGAIFAADL